MPAASCVRSGLCYALGLLAAASCVNVGPFRCSANDNCVLGGLQGTCEPTLYCSLPDQACQPSGRRYVSDAGEGLAGRCVNDIAVVGSGPPVTMPDASQLSLIPPAGWRAGDLLLVALYTKCDPVQSHGTPCPTRVTAPAGWQTHAHFLPDFSGVSSGAFGAWWYWKLADPADATVTFTFDQTSIKAQGAMIAYRFVDPAVAQGFDQEAKMTANVVGALDVPSILVARPGTMVVALALQDVDSDAAGWASPPSGVSKELDGAYIGIFDSRPAVGAMTPSWVADCGSACPVAWAGALWMVAMHAR